MAVTIVDNTVSNIMLLLFGGEEISYFLLAPLDSISSLEVSEGVALLTCLCVIFSPRQKFVVKCEESVFPF